MKKPKQLNLGEDWEMVFKIIALLLSFSIFTGCSKNPENNISTDLALKRYGESLKDQSFYGFAEPVERPLKWFDSIPEGKIKGSEQAISLSAQPGEFFVYQVGVWALRSDVKDLRVEFSDLISKDNKQHIPIDRMTCFNEGGIDHFGIPFRKEVNFPSGRIQTLWIGINLETIPAGVYTGIVSVVSQNKKQTIDLSLKVKGDKASNHGYDESAGMARLNWLNSTIGIDDCITSGFEPVGMEGNLLTLLGRSMTISENGLPASIMTYFNHSNTELNIEGKPVINNPIRFVIEKANGEMVRLQPGELLIEEQNASMVRWSVLNTSEEVNLKCTGQLEYDGFADYKLELSARKPISIRDIRLEISMERDRAEYMMGLGHEGGYRTPEWKWKWDTTKHQDKLWIGSVNGGLRVQWKAENYVRPLINVYYEFRPLNLPTSWGNGGKGGVNVVEKGNDVRIIAYSGDCEMEPGDLLHYDFCLLITPFKLINNEKKYGDRYYHGGGTNTSNKVEMAKKAGANIINIHHAEDVYPFINYPYFDECKADLQRLVDHAHNENMRMKVYYTTRELTTNLPEFYAFFSLDGELIFPGPGNECRTRINKEGPHEWLVKNLREKYIPAWPSNIKDGLYKGETDLSVITTPDSRLNNFYVAGLDWLIQQIGIDGVYIDDSSLDRFTVRRARKIIDNYTPDGRIDFHSVNHYEKWYGFASCLNLYMDLLPYFDLVWIGEGRDYNRMPDHWLIEVSGIPFGLSGQMLEGGGNPWRGMVYGITSRPGWFDPAPTGIWKCWDDYNIQDKTMIGYWEKEIPMTCNHPLVWASIYKGDKESLIAIANWSNEDQQVEMKVDFGKLGYDRDNCDIFIPDIQDFQEENTNVNLNNLNLPGGKGCIIVIKSRV